MPITSPGCYLCFQLMSYRLEVSTTPRCMRAKFLQSCPTLYDPMDCSPPSSSVHGRILRARILECVCHALIQGIFPTQGLNPSLLHFLYWQAGSYHQHHLGKPTSLTGFNQFARVAHRTQRNISLTRLLIYYKRLLLRNSQMEEIHRAKYMGRGTEFPWPLWTHHSQNINTIHQPGSSPNLPFALQKHNWLNHWPLVIDSTSSPSLLPEVGWLGLKLPTFWSPCWLSNQPMNPILRCSPIHLINITKEHFCLSQHLGNSKGFRSSVPAMGTKTK